MRILITEEPEHAATHLQKGLRENGFQVDTASNGADGFTWHDGGFQPYRARHGTDAAIDRQRSRRACT